MKFLGAVLYALGIWLPFAPAGVVCMQLISGALCFGLVLKHAAIDGLRDIQANINAKLRPRAQHEVVYAEL